MFPIECNSYDTQILWMASESRLPHRASIPFDPKSHRPRRELVTTTMATSLMEKFGHLLFVTGRRADPGKCLSHLADEVSSDYARTAAKQNRTILLRSVEKLFSYCCLTNWLFRISGDSRTSVRVTDLTFVVYFLFSRIYSSLHQASHSTLLWRYSVESIEWNQLCLLLEEDATCEELCSGKLYGNVNSSPPSNFARHRPWVVTNARTTISKRP